MSREQKMNVLGVHCGHNSSACLMKDGRIVGAVQEERFTKRKNQVAIPLRSIRHLVDVHLDGDAKAIHGLAFATRDVDPVGLVVSRYSDFTVEDHVREMHGYWRPVFYEGKPNDGGYWYDMYRRGECLNRDHNVDADALISLPLAESVRELSDHQRSDIISKALGWSGEVAILDHHSCHAYYAFRGSAVPPSDWQDVLVLTADSWGDGRNWSAWTVGEDGALWEIGGGADHGVARVYRFATLVLGMKPNEHEYKVMGLSSYSRSSPHIRATERVFYEILDFRDGQFVRPRPLKDSYFDLRDRLEGHRFDNISAALQNWATALTRAWIRHWMEKTGKRILCFSGGLSMNIKMNGELLLSESFRDFKVPASGGDESTSIGACFAHASAKGLIVEPMTHVYLGAINPDDPENDWRLGLERAGADPSDYAVRENFTTAELARLLASDHIVARCCGPMEFGARALGNRSILANPKNPANLKRINDAIKNRDFWMPFTPSILAERASDYLKIPQGVISPYMTIGYSSTERARTDIVAALHPGDFSARPQFVDRAINPDYWNIICAFEKLTGIGALLNTSLNLHGDPMNSSVADAARTLALSSLEFLAIPGDRLLYKRSASDALESALSESR